jgi:hypothetical protein
MLQPLSRPLGFATGNPFVIITSITPDQPGVHGGVVDQWPSAYCPWPAGQNDQLTDPVTHGGTRTENGEQQIWAAPTMRQSDQTFTISMERPNWDTRIILILTR